MGLLLRRKTPAGASANGDKRTCVSYKANGSSNKLFAPGVKLVVQRAPVMCGLTISAGLQKKFQRPMLKRRAYGKHAEVALQQSSLGPRRRMDGMRKLLARAGRGLSYKLPAAKTANDNSDTGSESESDDDDKEPERPFEPLQVWTSPHQGGGLKGLPPKLVTEMRPDEYGVEESVTVLKPAPVEAYAKDHVFVPPILAKWLRPHQRQGVQFLYECVMGLKDFDGQGCILADDMGLGKTLQSVTLIYTLLKTGIVANRLPTCQRVIVVCPCSLVKNWENEFVKWLGQGAVKALALAEADRKTVEKNIDIFCRTKMFNVLIASYECIRTHVGRLTKHADCCDLLVCDEAHRLKNSENQTSRALNSLPVKRRVLLTGTPMQNDLTEFYAMVDFTNPGILGTPEEFRRTTMAPILRGREPDATERQREKMMQRQLDMSTTVNDFILRRVNTVNAQHLPPKLVQVVCCNLTEIQQNMYQHLVNSKDMQHVLDGKQVNCLASIQMLMKLCNHPSLVAQEDDKGYGNRGNKRAASKTTKYTDDTEPSTAAPGANEISKYMPDTGSGRGGAFAAVHPEFSGKMFVLYRLIREMRKPGNGNDKIVIVSNYTQTLDLIGRMCRENSWGFCRLDGSITMKKRQKMVDDFNDPNSSLVAFLLSSKAGGCGLNLIGGNRLVLFDPDWNPAVDKQAAARCWRDGQKKRCFTYRFLATGTVEEKIFQRQLSKEGLQSVVDDKEQVNTLSTKDLRNLFKLRTGTPSDTHDKLRCERCEIIHDNAELEAQKVLPKKLAACRELLDELTKQEDATHFLKPLVAADYGVTKEEYEKLVKQPMDLGTIRGKLDQPPDNASAYKSVSGFSKDVNRIFSNVIKVWSPGAEIADAARRLQSWWVGQWTELVPRLMLMKADQHEESKPEDDGMDPVHEACATVDNERGDDYQEQIGMPDEENMRSWSHHYSTDTVDDPIFRAAMRGCDAVSFVFGLEVTWSLIQQRQQEEEERIALEELENMQEDDDEDDAVDDGDTKPAALPSNDHSREDGDDVMDTSDDTSGEDDVSGAVEEEKNEKTVSVDSSDSSSDDDDGSGQPVTTKAQEDARGSADSPESSSDDDDSEQPVTNKMTEDDSSDEEETGSVDSPKSATSESGQPTPNVKEDSSDESETGSMDSPESTSDDGEPRDSKKAGKNHVMDSLAMVGDGTASTSGKSTPSAEEERAESSAEESSAVDPSQESSTGTPETNASFTNQGKENTPQPPTPRPAAPATNEWECMTCTYHNKKSARKCDMCGGKKPRQTKKRSFAEVDA